MKSWVGHETPAPEEQPSALSRAPRPALGDSGGDFFGAGLLLPGPGSWGSAATVLFWWLARGIAPGWQPAAAIGLAALAVVVGIPAATQGRGDRPEGSAVRGD